jgi:aspartate/methionine/tyrosine aminotransferase
LLEHLATLEGLVPRVYRLEAQGGWQPDAHGLPLAGARALVSVHPNNPTGSSLERGSIEVLDARCAAHGVAWIVDEVFLDYPLGERPAATTAGRAGALTFTLGGLSKSVGLPQLKLGWIVVGGPSGAAEDALARLAFIADNYLSVATPVQLALGRLLAGGQAVRDAILARCRRNLGRLRQDCAAFESVTLIEPQGGWSAVVRYPHVVDEETLAVELLERHGVAVHPGYLFDFAEPGQLVVSLLPPPSVFDEGVARLLASVAEHLRGA